MRYFLVQVPPALLGILLLFSYGDSTFNFTITTIILKFIRETSIVAR